MQFFSIVIFSTSLWIGYYLLFTPFIGVLQVATLDRKKPIHSSGAYCTLSPLPFNITPSSVLSLQRYMS